MSIFNDKPCPRGLRRVDPRAYQIAEAQRCPSCGDFHKEDHDAELTRIRYERESVEQDQLEALTRLMLLEIADNEPDLSIGQARYLAGCLAKWAFNKGCRP